MVSYLKVVVLIRTGYCSLDHGLFNAIQNGGLVHNIDLKAKKYSSHVRGKVLVYAIGSGLCYWFWSMLFWSMLFALGK